MNNKVDLTDDEISVIATALQMSILSYEKHVEVNGEKGLDFETLESIKSMKALFNRLNKEYFS